MIYTGSGIVGNAAGGFLYQLLGAPLMFLVNGVSYLVSAFTELFIRVPRIRHERTEFRFFDDMKAGLTFVWEYRGIRWSIAVFALLNFFAVAGFTLFLPLYQRTAHLGPALYGLQGAAFTAGLFAGFLLMSFVNVPFRQRFKVFYACGIVNMLCGAAIPAWLFFPVMAGLAVVSGAANAVLNSFLNATLQAAVPQDKRGKVFSLMGTVSGGLTPLAMALAGVLAEFVSIRLLIGGAFLVTLACFLPLVASRPTVALVNFDPLNDTVEAIR
jgi:MFS family permease